jgi:hypothetical protein
VVHRVLITGAVAAMAVAASCYHPDLADCVDTCSSSHLCPDGTSCNAGFCRTSGATGTCNGAQVDASTSGKCPMAPGMQGICEAPVPGVPTAPECYTVCAGSAATGTAVQAYAFMTWRAAAMGSANDLADAKAMLGGFGALWIGLRAPPGMGSQLSAWSWVSGVPMNFTGGWAPGQPVDHSVGSGDNCGVLTGSGWVSEPCANSHVFMLQTPPMP